MLNTDTPDFLSPKDQTFLNSVTSEMQTLNLHDTVIRFIERSKCFHIVCANDKDVPLVLNLLKHSRLSFSILTDLFCVDFPKSKKRFEITYNLLSLKLNRRLMVKTSVDENTAETNSVVQIYKAANWYEREIYDMFGIVFKNHPDMRRILTDYGFVGHPLRKDFPVYGYTEIRYDDKQEKIVHEKVNLDQQYRNFDFSSPWPDMKYSLPGDEKASK